MEKLVEAKLLWRGLVVVVHVKRNQGLVAM